MTDGGYDPEEEDKPLSYHYSVRPAQFLRGSLTHAQVCRNGDGRGLIEVDDEEELEWIRKRLTGSRKVSRKSETSD